jgi:cell division protein FtsL
MREEEGVVLLGKTIDNSQVVREVDPRANRDIGRLLLLVGVLAAGLGLYAWPHLELRRHGMLAEQLSRERERLLEENRKLRLEKAALEDLRRVETIAVRELGLQPPPPERSIVVETPPTVPAGARLASSKGDTPERSPDPDRVPGERN